MLPYREADDAWLIAQLRSADAAHAEAALDALVARYEALCFRVAYHAVGNAADAEAIAVDALYRLWTAARGERLTLGSLPAVEMTARDSDAEQPSCAQPTTLGPWLSRVVLNAARGHQRAASRRQRHEQTAGEQAWQRGIDASTSAAAPGTAVEAAAELARVRDLLTRMPDLQREAFMLHVLEGRPQKEVADALGTTADTVKTLVHRARNALRNALGAI